MARARRPVLKAKTSTGLQTLTAAAANYGKSAGEIPIALDKNVIAQQWQVEAYRQYNINPVANYAVNLFAAIAGRAEIGISESQTLNRVPVWVNSGQEVQILAEVAPTVRDRAKLIRDYMKHRTIAGECYLISRPKQATDPAGLGRNGDVWEIVAVTELQRTGNTWSFRYDNDQWIPLRPDDAVLRMWTPDPSNRREATSPFRPLLETLAEIEYLNAHIRSQVKSRLVSGGVWFLPNNLTFPDPPPDLVQGGAEALSQMNDAERFLTSLYMSAAEELDGEEVAFPTVVLADPDALEQVDQSKLIRFADKLDEVAMNMRADRVRAFALGMNLPPEQILGSSGLAVTDSGGSAGSVNHWGVWANEEQTISAHVEPALDDLCADLTAHLLHSADPGTDKVVGYSTASLRLKQDRSKEALALHQVGLLNEAAVLRETGFDPEADKMGDEERKNWLLTRLTGSSGTPEQVAAAFKVFGIDIPGEVRTEETVITENKGLPGRNNPPNLDSIEVKGPPQGDHNHNDAAY